MSQRLKTASDDGTRPGVHPAQSADDKGTGPDVRVMLHCFYTGLCAVAGLHARQCSVLELCAL